jgi:multidrug efflux pump subunit AcrA (membrane-fusion protein)
MYPVNRTQLELEMRRKLLEAQKAYQSAAVKAKALAEKYRNFPSERGSHPDLKQAMEAEAQALEDYRRILKEFTDLVLRSKPAE